MGKSRENKSALNEEQDKCAKSNMSMLFLEAVSNLNKEEITHNKIAKYVYDKHSVDVTKHLQDLKMMTRSAAKEVQRKASQFSVLPKASGHAESYRSGGTKKSDEQHYARDSRKEIEIIAEVPPNKMAVPAGSSGERRVESLRDFDSAAVSQRMMSRRKVRKDAAESKKKDSTTTKSVPKYRNVVTRSVDVKKERIKKDVKRIKSLEIKKREKKKLLQKKNLKEKSDAKKKK